MAAMKNQTEGKTGSMLLDVHPRTNEKYAKPAGSAAARIETGS
jgi:hypothetical protein